MAAKKCKADHKGCSCGLLCCSVTPARVEEIRASAEASRGKSMFDGANASHSVMCRCGVPRKPPGTSAHVSDDGRCPAHPDKPPQEYTRGAERYG